MPSVSLLLLRKKLLAWYLREARDLPWRRTRDPYAIWVSEIMLQQTQVDTVIPYYERWLKKFPDITALAKAPLEEVLSSWAGLGYYRRARMLHKAAQVIVNDYGGNVPKKTPELLKLPGIGRYTAGAIASIAFEEKTPVLDGNVIRILTRIFAVKGDTLKPAVLSELWSLAEKLLPEKSIGDFNQALMELGALVCSPQSPSCTICPVNNLCLARAQGKQTFYPFKSRREKLEKIRNFAVIFRRNKKVWLGRQSQEARWGGLWMFPFWEEKAAMMAALKNHDSSPGKWISIKHGFTKYLIDLEVYTCKDAGSKKGLSGTGHLEARWVNIAELSDYALPAPHRKIAQSLVKEHL